MIGNLILAGSSRWKRLYCKVQQKGDCHLRVGIIGTGAISNLHARAYKNIGYTVRVCTDINKDAGRRFAAEHGTEFVDAYEAVCRHPEVDYVDVCTFPDFRLQPVETCANE